MGFFPWSRSQEPHSCTVPGFLTPKECRRLEAQMFSETLTVSKGKWLLAFAAPMPAKDGQRADGFPRYSGKKYDQMKKAFESSWGPVSEDTVRSQLERMLTGPCARELDPIAQILREYPQSQWEGQLSRAGSFAEKQLAKAAEFTAFQRRLHSYGMEFPSGTLYAYDLCRAGNLICIAVGLEALRPVNAPEYLSQVAWAANRYYTDWSGYYAAYVTGRTVWHWKQEQLLAMGGTVDLNCCRLLLHSSRSLCTEASFSQYLAECTPPASIYQPE